MQRSDKLFRTKKNQFVEDRGSLEEMSYNEVSGGQKNVPVGPHLVPLNKDGDIDGTCDATTIRALPLGVMLYIYNASAVVESIRFSSSGAATALAAGVVDVTTGEVGVPCAPNSYTIFTNYDKRYVIATSANLKVFRMLDGTRIMSQSISE